MTGLRLPVLCSCLSVTVIGVAPPAVIIPPTQSVASPAGAAVSQMQATGIASAAAPATAPFVASTAQVAPRMRGNSVLMQAVPNAPPTDADGTIREYRQIVHPEFQEPSLASTASIADLASSIGVLSLAAIAGAVAGVTAMAGASWWSQRAHSKRTEMTASSGILLSEIDCPKFSVAALAGASALGDRANNTSLPLRAATPETLAAEPNTHGVEAGENDTTPLMKAAFDNAVAEVQKLVEGGADINAQDSYGWTALRFAARAGQVDAAGALIELGADVNLASKSGNTPLMSAASSGYSDMIEFLLKAGADTKATNNQGETAFRISMRGGVTGCAKCRQLLSEA